MTKQEQLEQKVADTKAAADSAYDAYDDVDLADYIDHAAASAAYAAANAAHVDAEAACVKAMNELEQYIKEQAND